MAYKIKFSKLHKSKTKDVYISKSQIKELNKLSKDKDISGVVVYLEEK